MKNQTAILTVLLSMLYADPSSAAPFVNGFGLANSTIPIRDIRSGGPGRDGIPSIDNPRFVSASDVDFLKKDDSVLSVTIAGETRAYPLRILDRHEIVNDRIGDEAFMATYCPLCATAMVFSREFGGKVLDFGVSGLLYQSDVLMYDRQTESLWSQLGMKAVSGPMADTPLRWMPSTQMTWAEWKAAYPGGRVLSDQTGFGRNYSQTAYEHYRNSPGTMFPAPQHRTELKPKELIAGIVLNGRAKAYPIYLLEKRRAFTDQFGGTELSVHYDRTAQQITIKKKSTGEPIPSVQAYWFAWQAFYPDTELEK